MPAQTFCSSGFGVPLFGSQNKNCANPKTKLHFGKNLIKNLTNFQLIGKWLIVDDIHSPLCCHNLLYRVDIYEATDRFLARASKLVLLQGISGLEIRAVVKIDQNSCKQIKATH